MRSEVVFGADTTKPSTGRADAGFYDANRAVRPRDFELDLVIARWNAFQILLIDALRELVVAERPPALDFDAILAVRGVRIDAPGQHDRLPHAREARIDGNRGHVIWGHVPQVRHSEARATGRQGHE